MSLRVAGPWIAAVLLVGCSRAPTPPPAKSPDQSTATRPAPAPWSPPVFEFNSEVAKEPEIGVFFAALHNRSVQLEKKEFETTAEHQARLADLDAALAPLSLSATYVFFPQDVSLQYDADKETYAPKLGVICSERYPRGAEGIACKFAQITDRTYSYEGRNAFGTGAQVQSREGRTLYLDFPRATFAGKRFRTRYWLRLPADCPVPLDVARQFGSNGIRVGYVVSIREPKVLKGETEYQSPTVDAPYEKKFVDRFLPATLHGYVCARPDGTVVHSERFSK